MMVEAEFTRTMSPSCNWIAWWSVVLLTLVGGAAPIAAQNAAPDEYAIRKRICRTTIPASAFSRVVIYAFVDVGDSTSEKFASAADGLLQELVTESQHLLGAQHNHLPQGEPSVLWSSVDAPLQLTAYRDGRIAARGVQASDSTTASLMARALDSISSFGLLTVTKDSLRDSVRFDIDFVRPSLDSAGHVTSPKVKRSAIPVFSESMPWEEMVSQKAGQAHPHYPEAARVRNYEGTVILQFIVDSTGHAQATTIRDLWPDARPRYTGAELEQYTRFVEASTKGVLRIEFVPARIGGCKVNQLVQMPFVYGLNKR